MAREIVKFTDQMEPHKLEDLGITDGCYTAIYQFSETGSHEIRTIVERRVGGKVTREVIEGGS